MFDEESLGQNDIIYTIKSWGNSENVKIEEWLLPFILGTSVFQTAVQQHEN